MKIGKRFLIMASDAKIFVIYHSLEEMVKSDVYQPICVGPNKHLFGEDYFKDDVGENIADKNSFYNEMTAIYWVYKHLDIFKETKYLGFVHYRRFFAFNDLRHTAYVKKNLNRELIDVTPDKLDRMFSDYDFLIPYPNHYKSVKRHYEKSHNKEDVDAVLNIIKEMKPSFYGIAKDYFESSDDYSYNMFVFKKEHFVQYCEFVFPILDRFVSLKDEIDRLYISERLTGIFISYLISIKKKPLKLPVLHIRKKSFKKAIEQSNSEIKSKKNSGLFYKFKSLILCLMPRFIEQMLRRKKAK